MTIVDRNKPEGDGWHWRPGGFVVVGALLFGAGFVYEFLASKMNSRALKLALGLAMTFSVLAIWVEVAVDGVSRAIELLLGCDNSLATSEIGRASCRERLCQYV